jgi:ABC-type transport system involved in multi-copper enzyme maturation permease subunit
VTTAPSAPSTARADARPVAPASSGRPDGTGLSFPRIVRSEWLKLRTLRSTWITLGVAVVVLVLAAGLIANHLHGRLVHPRFFEDARDRDVLTTPLRGFGVTQLVVGVLGVLAITGEYATGMIRATLTAVPRRLPVLWAKLIVFAVLAFAAMLVATFAAFFTAQAILGSYGVGLGAPHAVRVVVALAGFLALVGVLGLGLGFIVRSTAGGIAALVGILLVAPGILSAFSTSWATTASHYLPLNAGQAMFSDTHPTGGELTPGGGTAVMAAWVVASVVGAAVLLTRRDA